MTPQQTEWFESARWVVETLTVRFVKANKWAIQEDIQQELLIFLWKITPKYLGAAKFSTFAYRCIQRKLGTLLFNHMQKLKISIESLSDNHPAPERAEHNDDLSKLVEDLLSGIPPEYEKVLRWRYLEGLSNEAIAELTGLRRTQLCTRIRTGLLKIRRNAKHLLRRS